MSDIQEHVSTQEPTPEPAPAPIPDSLSWLAKYGLKPFSTVYPTLGKPCTYMMSRGRRKGEPCAEDSEREEAGGPVCFNHSEARMKSRVDIQRRRCEREYASGDCPHIIGRGYRKGKPCGRESEIPEFDDLCATHRCSRSFPHLGRS